MSFNHKSSFDFTLHAMSKSEVSNNIFIYTLNTLNSQSFCKCNRSLHLTTRICVLHKMIVNKSSKKKWNRKNCTKFKLLRSGKHFPMCEKILLALFIIENCVCMIRIQDVTLFSLSHECIYVCM